MSPLALSFLLVVGCSATELDPFTAADRGDADLLQSGLQDGRLQPDARCQLKGFEGWTLLHFAAKGGHTNLCQLLVEEGADIDATSDAGATPLHVAVGNRRPALVALFLRLRARRDVVDEAGLTPAQWAVAIGDRQIASLFGAVLVEDADSPASLLYLAIDAIEQEDIESLRQLLSTDYALLQTKDEAGRTLLHHAAGGKEMQCVELLLQRGADIGSMDGLGATPMHVACTKGRLEAIECLLAHGARIEAGMTDPAWRAWTPLHLAAHADEVAAVEKMLSIGADVESKTGDGGTALHVAAGRGSREVVDILIEYGADVGAVDRDSWTPMLWAALCGKSEVARILQAHSDTQQTALNLKALEESPAMLYAGTGNFIFSMDKPDEAFHLVHAFLKSHPERLNRLHVGNYPLLTMAAKSGCARVVELLLRKGADPDIDLGTDRGPALAWAVQSGYPEIVRALLEANASIPDRAVAAAVIRGHLDMGQLMVKAGAPLDFHTAAALGHLDKVRAELEHRPDLLERELGSGFTALLLAVRFGEAEVARYLLDEGASSGKQDTELGWAPIHWAVANGGTRMLKTLLQSGASLDIVTRNGQSALHMSCAGNDLPATKLLLEHGAHINAVDEFGGTPLDFVDDERLVRFLRDNGAVSGSVDDGFNHIR